MRLRSLLKTVIQRYGTLALLVNVLAGVLAGPALAAPVTILALGDSLTAGYGLPPEAAFPVRLEQALRSEGRDVRVINAGVSGDTTAGGLARLEGALTAGPDVAIVELGANDGLRGLDPKLTYGNLNTILDRLGAKRIDTLLTGMKMPPNYGRAYEAEFTAIYPRLAAGHKVVFYPFFLAGVAADLHLMQADGMHPNAAGVDVVVAHILPSVRELLDRHAAGFARVKP